MRSQIHDVFERAERREAPFTKGQWMPASVGRTSMKARHVQRYKSLFLRQKRCDPDRICAHRLFRFDRGGNRHVLDARQKMQNWYWDAVNNLAS